MGRRHRMGDEGFCIAEVVADVDQRQPIERGESFRPATLDFKRDERAAAGHLRARQRMLRMAFKARINHFPDRRMGGEKIGDLFRIVAMFLDAQVKRFDTFKQVPCIEGAQRRTRMLEVWGERLFDEFLGAKNDAAKTSTLPVNMLRCGIDDDVGAKVQWMLQHRRCKYIVDDYLRANFVCDLGNG